MISKFVETFPPAKLNLYLELLGKRADNYHDLETLMIAIDRCDRMRVSRTDHSEIRLDCRWAPSTTAWSNLVWDCSPANLALPAPQHNLVYRAVQKFRDKYQVGGGFHIDLEKRIPAGAGMGGASSNAASALLCAAAITGIPNDDPGLYDLATELGSDVPFFLGRLVPGKLVPTTAAWPAGMAIATGRGEFLETIPGAPEAQFVVVFPPQPLSTAAVFQNCAIASSPRSLADIRAAVGIWNLPKLAHAVFNRLAEPARCLSPWIDRTLTALEQTGLTGVTMTGSGSACFGLASSARTARQAVAKLAGRRCGICFSAGATSLPANIRFLT